MNSAGDKHAWRRKLLEQREATAETTRSAENDALRETLLSWVREHRPAILCGYVPVGPEPGSPELLDAILDAGCRVLLPIVIRGSALDWAEYEGPHSLRTAGFGLLEPSGTALGPAAPGEAEALLVPGLAVDRRGVRLGRGAGYYDRSLPMASPKALLIAIIRDAEFVAELPGEAHDVRMNAVVTPDRGLVYLPV